MIHVSKFFAKAHEIAMKHRATARVPVLLDAKKVKDVGELYIYAPIGASWWSEGVTAQQVVEKLDALKGVGKLCVRINSEGGEIWEGKAIENAIRRFSADEKVTCVDGLAASAATFIAMACPKVISAPNATWMIHEAATIAIGRASDMRATADVLDLENRTIAETYAKKTGKSVEECLAAMAAETWMNAEQSKEFGFTDEIEAALDEEPEQRAAAASPIRVVAALERLETPAEREANTLAVAAAARAARARLNAKFSGASPGQQHTGQPVTAAKK